ncbi:MAG: ABC transporter ATP-binding protein [Streptococcus sp.]|nr:ABC transporter ATP-binding protein [Streptococcus sp.]
MHNHFRRLWFYLKNYKFSFYSALFLKLLSSFLSVLEPFILGLAITELTNNLLLMARKEPSASLNVNYILMILTLYLLRGMLNELCSFYANFLMTKTVQGSIKKLRNDLSQKLNRLPISYSDRHQFGNLLGRFTSDIETVSNALQQSLLQIVSAVSTLVFVIVMVIYIDALLSTIVLGCMLLTFLAARIILKKSQPYFKKQADILGEMNGFVQENLTGFHIIKLYGREKESKKEFRRILNDLYDTGFKASFISGMMVPVLNTISDITYLLVTLFSGLKVLAGQMTLGNMQAYVQYLWQITQPIQNITQLSGVLQSAQSSLERIFEILDEAEERDTTTLEFPKEILGEIRFEQVNFQYSDDKPLIKKFNLMVKPGQMVAIVGPTGAGKTTLINLLMRFYDVTSGRILVDGYDISQISRKKYRREIGMVLQDTWLYEASIMDNLKFGKEDASEREVVAAAKMANIDHFIRTLPGGYQMQLNQESSNVSQGQKQLLTIARALLANPKILILDEATSSVDTRLEQHLQRAMAKLMQGRTSFVIAHRLSTIQEADIILVLKDGQIIEQGNHQSLLKSKGFYSELYYSQFNQN